LVLRLFFRPKGKGRIKGGPVQVVFGNSPELTKNHRFTNYFQKTLKKYHKITLLTVYLAIFGYHLKGAATRYNSANKKMTTQNFATTTVTWKVNKKVSALKTSLAKELPGITNETIKKLFGRLPSGCNPREKYSGFITLTNDSEPVKEANSPFEGSGIYTLYCANGKWRIGGFFKNQFTDQLAEYINSNK